LLFLLLPLWTDNPSQRRAVYGGPSIQEDLPCTARRPKAGTYRARRAAAAPPSAACQRCCWCRPGRASPIARAGATGGQARHRVILTARAISVPFRARRQWPPRSCTCRPSYDPTVGNATARRPSGSRWLSRERAVLPWQLLLCAEPAALTGTAMSILISSDQLPAGERFERWRETLRQSRMAPVEVQSDAEADLRFELRYRDLGAIRVVLATATRIGYGGPQADPPIGSRSALAPRRPGPRQPPPAPDPRRSAPATTGCGCGSAASGGRCCSTPRPAGIAPSGCRW
jgi:hypothetical protein